MSQTLNLTRHSFYSVSWSSHISPPSQSHSYLLLGRKQTMPDSTQLPPVAQLCRWSHGLLSSALPAVLCSVLRCTVLYCAVLCWPGLGLTHIRTSVCCSGVWCGGNFQLFELWQEVTPGCSGPSDSEGVLHSWKCTVVSPFCFCIIILRVKPVFSEKIKY